MPFDQTLSDHVASGVIKSEVELCANFKAGTLNMSHTKDIEIGRRPETVGFVKVAEGKNLGVIRPNRDGSVSVIEPEVGMDIYAHDTVCSHNMDGKVDIIFTDNSVAELAGESQLNVNDMVYKKPEQASDFQMRLGRGVVSVPAGEVAKIKGDTMSVKVRNDTNHVVVG